MLLAEDDAEMRSLLAAVLRGEGYFVHEARDGLELADLLARSLDGRSGLNVNLVISDIRMPGHGGLAILEALRSVDWAIPVFVMTAFGHDELRAEAQRLGARFLDKPFDIEELRVAARRILGPAGR